MRPRSIAWRLSAMFAAVAMLIFALVGVALQRVLQSELDRQQRSELETKSRFGEQLIEHCKGPDKWHFVQARFDGLMAGQDSTQFWVLSDDPRFTYGNSDTLAALQPAPVAEGFSDSTRRQRPLRSLVRRIAADEQRPAVRLIVAIDPSPYRHTLRTFAIALALLSTLGVTLAAVLGHWVARLGLAPLARLSREAQGLSPRQLSQRLRLAPLPPELSELSHSFNGALDRLEQAYLQLQAFNADVAHELRTPLTNLIGQTEVALARPRSADDFAEVLHSNLEELDRLRGIINDMLFLARADQGERAERREPRSLAAEVGKAIEFMEVVLDEAGMTVRIDGDAQLGIETALFRRAITNLLQNAVQYSSPGAAIGVAIEAIPGGARVAVSNAGAAIEEAHIGRLFDRFYRVDPSRGSDGASHGLGLAIVKAVATMHSGIVFARSCDGINTIGFTLVH
ncbi:heavy metal sensor histidine kinase [Solimonas terrae]|uniref:Sensor protein n=1 Tax=Solimonas terrae TaxID=1396819 RepID=A0A6M2BUF2_9GAMM|nr:heavy metal sensor histidine kinase [Solimonas terrae]NGY06004.1 heavy metal sensor histidine kinase [Solimonas terrae]